VFGIGLEPVLTLGEVRVCRASAKGGSCDRGTAGNFQAISGQVQIARSSGGQSSGEHEAAVTQCHSVIGVDRNRAAIPEAETGGE